MSTQDWVRERARCTAAHYFDELSKVIPRNVDTFNKLEAVRERKSGFSVMDGVQGTLEIRRARMRRYTDSRIEWVAETTDEDFVAVWHSDTTIHAKRGCCWSMEIELRWNHESLACDTILAGEARALVYISQRILGDFMFEDLS